MHIILGFVALVACFALFPRTAILFALGAAGLGAIALLISLIHNINTGAI